MLALVTVTPFPAAPVVARAARFEEQRHMANNAREEELWGSDDALWRSGIRQYDVI